MGTIQIVFSTAEGQTKKIVEYIAERCREHGYVVELADVAALVADWRVPEQGAVLVAASVHVGRHSDAVTRFVGDHAAALGSATSAFVSVSLAARDAAHRAEAREYVAGFLQKTGWRPTLTATVAGSLRYSRYGLFKRLLMKRIAKREGLPTDTSRDHEFTDWAEVRQFAGELVRQVEGATEREAPRPEADVGAGTAG